MPKEKTRKPRAPRTRKPTTPKAQKAGGTYDARQDERPPNPDSPTQEAPRATR